jgi:hypothetical protein
VLEGRIGTDYVSSGASVRRSRRYKLAAAGAIAAAIAVLAGIAGLALTAGSSHGRHASGPPRRGHAQRASGHNLQIPAGTAGVRSAAGGRLAEPVVTRFSTAGYSQLRLDQLLSTLGYLPLSWQPSGRMISDPTSGGVATQKEMAYNAPIGAFIWQPGYPAMLHSQWQTGRPNLLIRGAVMAFKAQHQMAITAVTSRTFWRELLAAVRAGQRNAFGYTYAIATKGSPETLTIWHNGRVVLRSLASTGTAVTPTWSGTFPVYLRYRYQIMRGIKPDGRRYADPVSFVAYFNGGEAVHYFPRRSYGFAQSLGCVELPYGQAQRAWPYLTYGSLVSVTG